MSELQPVLLMGRGHSGTRVLAYACAHLGIELGISTRTQTGDPDDRVFTRTIKKIAIRNMPPVMPDRVVEKDLVRFQNAVSRYYEQLGRPRLWGWKFPETYLVGAYVARTFPRARYIHIVRDGRDLAFKRHLTDDPKRALGKKLLGHIGSLAVPHYLQAARSWAFQVDHFDELRAAFSDGQVLDIKFEDMCLQPVESMQSVCDFLNLPMTDMCRDYLSRHLNVAKVAQYRNENARDIAAIEAAIGAALTRYRYL